MRIYVLLLSALLSLSVFSQNSNRQLLKNDIVKRSVKARNRVSAYNYGRHYRGEHRFGNSEVFLSIPDRGYYTVEIEDQMMSNPRGKFRFFEVGSGHNVLSIYRDGYVVYRTRISVPNRSRLVLELISGDLYLLDVYTLSDIQDAWEGGGNGTTSVMDSEMSTVQFGFFKQMVHDEADFDKDKIKMIDMQIATGAAFNAFQVKDLLSLFSFDSNRLKMAKKLYEVCLDKNNYFLVLDAFDFETSKKELTKYIRGER